LTIERDGVRRIPADARPTDEEFLSLFRLKLIDELDPTHADTVTLYREFSKLAKDGNELDRYLLGLLDIIWELRRGNVVNKALMSEIGARRKISSRGLADVWMIRRLVRSRNGTKDRRG
jgi:hypothetical protein